MVSFWHSGYILYLAVAMAVLLQPPVHCLWDLETNETLLSQTDDNNSTDSPAQLVLRNHIEEPKKLNITGRSKSVFIDSNDFERLYSKLSISRIIQFRDQLLFSTNYLKLSNLSDSTREELFSANSPQQIRFSYDLKSKEIRLLPQVTYLDSLYKFQPVYGLSSMLVITTHKVKAAKNKTTSPVRDCLQPNVPDLSYITTTTTPAPTTTTTPPTTVLKQTIRGKIVTKILYFKKKVLRTIKPTTTTVTKQKMSTKSKNSLMMRSMVESDDDGEQSFQVETFVYGVNSRSSDSTSITMTSMSLICSRRHSGNNNNGTVSAPFGFVFSENCRAANVTDMHSHDDDKDDEDDEDHEDHENDEDDEDDEEDDDYDDDDDDDYEQGHKVIKLGIDNRLLYSIVQIENETIFLAKANPNIPLENQNNSELHPNILIIPNLQQFWGSFYYNRYLNVLLPGNIIYRYSLAHINHALRTDQILHSPDEMATVDHIFGGLEWKTTILSLIANDHEIQRIFIKSEEEQTRLTIIAIILCVLLCLFVAILIFIAICISRDRGGGGGGGGGGVGDDVKEEVYNEPSMSMTTSRPKGLKQSQFASRNKQPQFPMKYGSMVPPKNAMKPYDMASVTNASDYMTVNDSNFEEIYKFKSAEDLVRTMNAVTASDDTIMMR